jgi:TrmH family RNA methyltransferase
MIKIIQSKENQQFKQYKRLLTKKYRDREGLFLIEGKRLVDDAIEKEYPIEQLIVRMTDAESQEKYNALPMVLMDDRCFDELSDTVHSQGVIGVARQPEDMDIDFTVPLLILDQIQDPGNMGTIIRTAVSAGVSQIATIKGSVDAFNSKVVRSTAGAIFSVKLIQSVDGDDLMAKLKKGGYQIIGSSLEQSVSFDAVTYQPLSAMIIGNEGNGINPNRLEMTDINVSIPIKGPVESLNAAVAAGILIYEWGKQLNK